MKQKAVFLDRDGVINDAIVKNGKPYPPANLNELTISADVLPALQNLKSLGYLLIGATNQPDVARGVTDMQTVEALNNLLIQQLPLDEIRVCYHDDRHQCNCRKPMPGLLLQAAKELEIDLANSFMIGDRWKDIEAGQRAGCKTIWIDRNYTEAKPAKMADYNATSLGDAAEWIKQLGEAK